MFLNIKLTEASIDLCIGVLRKLPHEQVHDLVMDMNTQKVDELKRIAAENKEPKPAKVTKVKLPKVKPAEPPVEDVLA